jgi:hypothetical protein
VLQGNTETQKYLDCGLLWVVGQQAQTWIAGSGNSRRNVCESSDMRLTWLTRFGPGLLHSEALTYARFVCINSRVIGLLVRKLLLAGRVAILLLTSASSVPEALI